MKAVNCNAKANSILLNLIFSIIMVFAYSCGGGGGGGDSSWSSGSGTVRFGLALQDSNNNSRALFSRAVDDTTIGFECQTVDYVISTIEAQVINGNGDIVAPVQSFDCVLKKGTIDGIEPGANYTVFIVARDSEGNVIFEGKSEPFAVVAGAVAEAGIIVLARINARLSGDFGGTGFGYDTDGFLWAIRFDATFEGDGNGSYQELANSEEDPQGGDLTYDLNFDGSLTATLSDGTELNGILNPDKNILAVADTDRSDEFDESGDSIEMDVAIKKTSGLSNAVLNGNYIGVRIGDNTATALISLTFAGNGNGAFQFLAASNGDLESGNIKYALASDGELTISSDGDIASEGIVSGDGSIASLVDTDFRGGNEDIDMTVLIKTSSGLSNATIDGDFVAVSFAFISGDESESETTTLWKISADGMGNIQFEILSNSGGASGTIDTTYAVEPNGRIVIGPPSNQFFEGIVSGNGDVFNFVDTNPTDDFIEMGVAIKNTQ